MSIVAKTWATRGLRAGDLTALAGIASGRRLPDGEPTERLRERRFVRERADTSIVITLRGRLALIIKRFAMR
jgi:hypothetical protein